MSKIDSKASRTRTEPSQEEIEIRKNAISSQIKKDFLKSDVSYVDTGELTFLVGKVRQTDNTRKEVRKVLLENFGASFVSVGDSKMAIVKRPKTQA